MGSNGGASGRDYHKRKSGGGGAAKEEEQLLPAAVQQKTQEKKTSQNAPPKTVEISDDGKRVNYDEYRKKLASDPLPDESKETAKIFYNGNLKNFAIRAAVVLDGQDRMEALGITKALYNYPELATAWYRGMAKLVHPDVNGDSKNAAKAMKWVSMTYKNMTRQ